MGAVFDVQWAEALSRVCDPVFDAADVGFVRQVSTDPSGNVGSLLWEADPERFAARYPDSGVEDSYGPEQWPSVRCIDYWLYVEPSTRTATFSVEGWGLVRDEIVLTGDGEQDGRAVASVFARILRVDRPT